MNLLLVDSTIPSINTFLNGINQNTKIVTYSITDSFNTLKEKIANLQVNSFDNVGFVFIDEINPLKMFVSFNTFISFDSEGINANNTTKFINEIVTMYSVKKLDFLACNLLSYPQWKDYFDYLMKENDSLIVRASNDKTGNLNYGGNWILESTNEDITQLYFNENINNWNGLLDLNTQSSIIQSFDSNLIGTGLNNYGEFNSDSVQSSNSFRKISNYTNILKVACGGYFTMVILTNGKVYGSGANGSGQLGNNTTTNQDNFVEAFATNGAINDATDISCGFTHSMIIRSGGTVWGSGNNSSGQLGDNTTTSRSVFTQSSASDGIITNATKIVSGYSHSIILRSNGTVWGTGNNGSGQLGDNTTTSRSVFTQSSATNGSITDATDVATKGWHTLIIRSNGSVWSTGDNSYGQQAKGAWGAGNTIFTQCKFEDDTYVINATKIACGWYHSIIAVSSNSNSIIFGVGNNEYGHLGIGSTTNKNKFVQATLDIDNNVVVNPFYIACTYNGTLIIKSDKSIWGCGQNYFGELGFSLALTTTKFKQILAPSSGQIYNSIYLDAGVQHSMTIRNYTSYTELWGAGTENSGQLNTNYKTNTLNTLTNYEKNSILCVANGLNHTMIVKKDGTVWGCGLNDWGQLGDGTTMNRTTFTQALNINNAAIVSCGSKHSMIILTNGKVYGCGFNLWGQLGNGNETASSTFIQCTNAADGEITNAIDISCGEGMTMIIRSDGNGKRIWGCGLNTAGQLGIPTTTSSVNVFTKSNDSITNAEQIACGTNYTIVLKSDNTIAGTGANNVGQLGLENIISPIQTFTSSNITDVKYISCGRLTTYVLKNNGTVWGCGLNNYGQLGIGNNLNVISSFTQATNVTNCISIKSFYEHTYIMLNDGTLMASGLNDCGQLGKGDYVNRNTFTQISYSMPKIKIANRKKVVNVDPSSTISTFNNLDNVCKYLPNSTSTSLIASNVSASDTTSAFYNAPNRSSATVIKLEPSGTVFSDYINFDMNVTTTDGILVYFKSENDSEPIRIYQNPVNDYGAYFTIPEGTTNTIRIYTKHFTEGAAGTGNFCLLKGTKVLTPEGYKLIETLKCNDLVITDDNREVAIKMIHKTIINANEKPNFIPYKIEKNSIAENYPMEDTYMSGYHMIKYENNWIEPVQSSKFRKDLSIKEIVYYHIQLENYETDNLVINGGLVVESLGNGSSHDGKIWLERSNNSLIIE